LHWITQYVASFWVLYLTQYRLPLYVDIMRTYWYDNEGLRNVHCMYEDNIIMQFLFYISCSLFFCLCHCTREQWRYLTHVVPGIFVIIARHRQSEIFFLIISMIILHEKDQKLLIIRLSMRSEVKMWKFLRCEWCATFYKYMQIKIPRLIFLSLFHSVTCWMNALLKNKIKKIV
jgi:hypothetical protein